MATIKFRRGSGQPAGLTAYEPAWDTTNNRLFVNNGSTAMWVGAQVVQDTTLAGNCAFFIPTQNAVKTYVDNQVTSGLCAGAVASVNGVTGAVVISGSTGISVLASTSLRGITVSVNSDVALRNAANTYSVLQTFTNGITAGGTSTLADLIVKDNLDVGGTAWFTQDVRFSGSLANNSAGITIGDNLRVTGTTELTGGLTTKSTISAQGLATFLAGLTASGGSFGTLYVSGAAAIDGPVSLLGGFDAKGATFGSIVKFNAGLSATSIFVTGGATFNGNIYAPNLVSSVDGVTGAVDLLAGSGISITNPTGTAKGITLANTGVLSIASGNTAISFNASTGSVTGTFNGVHTIAGTANQITASSSTGSVTLSLPSAVTMPGSLTVTGDLTVNGTTTTVNSTTVTVQDPLIAIGGVTGNAPPPVGDTKDRGIVFQWATGVTGQTGFFGFDQSAQRFTFIPSGASVVSEIVSGVAGNANLAGVYAPQGTLTLQGTSAGIAQISLAGGTGNSSSLTTFSSYDHLFTSAAGIGRITVSGDPIDSSLRGSFIPPTYTATRTYTLPDLTGQMVVASTAPVQGRILRGDVSGSPPQWIDPTSSGFTAFAATNADNLKLTATTSNTNFNITFASGNSGYQIHYADTNNAMTWNPSTTTLTVGAGLGKFEGVIEGGTF